jgi:acetyl esterase
MKLFYAFMALVNFCFAQFSYSQDNNFKKDYSFFLSEARDVNQQLRQMPKGPSILTPAGILIARNALMPDANAKLTIIPTVLDVAGKGFGFSLRVFKPKTIKAVVLDFHGGGWAFGSAATDDAMNDEMARMCDVAVVSVDYRLAPENKFPAGVEDCKQAAKWLIAHAQEEFGTDKIFLSGASAGAHLAALTTLYIRDSLHAIDKVLGVNLVYGCFDLSRTPSSRMASDTSLILTRQFLNESFQLVFAGWTTDRLRDPKYSPLYANLRDLPPALFTIGAIDPTIDDTYFMESRWRLAGNKTYLAVYPESPHGFNTFPTQMARAANGKIYEWMKERL